MKIFKKGQSTGFGFMIGIFIIFVIGIMTILFNTAIADHILPISQTMLNASPYLNATELTEVNSMFQKGSFVWDMIPIIFFLIVIVFVLVNSLLKHNTNQNS